ncbi:unnamed protein product [Spirodela intermedia]|uniref:Uncharacterized protein n=1 Tax=Spirodela intermedia TaxID=51605 RepID=A0A7I8I947_SPIIN|nr:unnamed protein product [Spirodela intermedia]CAA6654169.1 unnamed protein product [Spirodela intermedia]
MYVYGRLGRRSGISPKPWVGAAGVTDGSLSSASNLAKLLPIDTVLTFQSSCPSSPTACSPLEHGVHHLPHYSQGDRIGSDSQYRGRINLR